MRWRRRRLWLRRDTDLGCEHEPRDGSCVLKSGTHDFGRIDDPGRDKILKLTIPRIEAPERVSLFDQLADDNRSLNSGILRDLTRRRFDGTPDNLNSGTLILARSVEPIENPG
jgi:hypothetical protein